MQEGLDATINERVGGTNELHVNTVEERKGGELVDVSRSKSNHLVLRNHGVKRVIVTLRETSPFSLF